MPEDVKDQASEEKGLTSDPSEALNVPETEESDEDESVEGPAEEPEVDYKAAFEKLQGVHAKTKGALVEARRQKKELQRQQGEEPEEESPDLEERISAAVYQAVQERFSDRKEELIRSVSTNQDEAELIRLILDKRIKSSGPTESDFKNDLMEAKLLANKERFKADVERSVKKQMAEKKALQDASVDVPGKKQERAVPPNLSKEDLRFLKLYGVDPREVKS